ncbi:MAG: FHA domain-containing protein [Chloroflexi bacterium]|nr:FHA domain-containing protein [Chloroflexota bacterium]MCL5076379.1 FHA domain-containing protein [Chloroflexota bacterium]
MNTEIGLFLLRLGFMLTLYLFLLILILLILRDLRAASLTEATEASSALGQLAVIEGNESNLSTGQVFHLRPVTSIGRDPNNVIVLADSFVSGQHALLAQHNEAWWLADLGSTNGTFVNRQRIQEKVQLKAGDIVQIGRVILKFTE